MQHRIQASTSAPFAAQLEAIHARVALLLDAAAGAGAQVVCLQEAWHMPFAFCTREKKWCEFAEPVHGGPSVALCRRMAKKHGMVVVCPILERDVAHGETVHNTAVVISHTGDVIGIHHMMFLSHSYDHRIVDGALGGSFEELCDDYDNMTEAFNKPILLLTEDEDGIPALVELDEEEEEEE